MPIAQQYAAMNLADKLRAISSSLASAAELGAKTAHRLHALAHNEVSKVDDSAPLCPESIEALKGVGVLTKLANDSSQIAVNLLNANRDAAKEANRPPEDPQQASRGVLVVPGLAADPEAWAKA